MSSNADSQIVGLTPFICGSLIFFTDPILETSRYNLKLISNLGLIHFITDVAELKSVIVLMFRHRRADYNHKKTAYDCGNLSVQEIRKFHEAFYANKTKDSSL